MGAKHNWTTIGEEWTERLGGRGRIENAIASLGWEEAQENMTLPAMPGMGIQEAIKQLRIPKVSHIAISSELAPCGLYGIRGHYRNGDADIFILDHGDALTPLVSFFTPKEVS